MIFRGFGIKQIQKEELSSEAKRLESGHHVKARTWVSEGREQYGGADSQTGQERLCLGVSWHQPLSSG